MEETSGGRLVYLLITQVCLEPGVSQDHMQVNFE